MTPKEHFAQLAETALEATDGFLAAAQLTAEQLDLHNQVVIAASFASAAYDAYEPKSGGEGHALARAFLIALFDPAHPDLDYLRPTPEAGPMLRAALVEVAETPADNWMWWAGDGDKYYTIGPCETREQVIAEARDDFDDGFNIIEATQDDDLRFADMICLDQLIEQVNLTAYENYGDIEGDVNIIDLSDDQVSSLKEAIRSAVNGWQNREQLQFKSWRFAKTRNEEWIEGESDDV